MTSAVKTYGRPDEKQFVFIFRTAEGFTIAEIAESWHPAQRETTGARFHYYPAIFYAEEFESLDGAISEVARRYPWVQSSLAPDSA